MSKVRYAEIERETADSRVRVVLALDGGTRRDVLTGLGYFDYLLQLMAQHAQFDLGVSSEADLSRGDLQTLENVGSVLGQAIREASAASDPVVQLASNHTPVDEALILVSIDLGGKGSSYVNLDFNGSAIGPISCQNFGQFFEAFARSSNCTLHIHEVSGANDSHRVEAAFKGLGRALHQATRIAERSSMGLSKALTN